MLCRVLEGLLVMGEGRKGNSLDFACQHTQPKIWMAGFWRVYGAFCGNIAVFVQEKEESECLQLKKSHIVIKFGHHTQRCRHILRYENIPSTAKNHKILQIISCFSSQFHNFARTIQNDQHRNNTISSYYCSVGTIPFVWEPSSGK